MINDKSRKHITNAALVYVLSMMVSMFIVFLNVGDTVIYLQIGFDVIKSVAVMWLAYGFISFYKEEKNKAILITAIVLFVAAQFGIIVQTMYVLYASGVVQITRLTLLPTNLTEIVATLGFAFGFYQLKM